MKRQSLLTNNVRYKKNLHNCTIHQVIFHHLWTSQTIKVSIISNASFCSPSSSLCIWLFHSLGLHQTLNLWGHAESRWEEIRTKNPSICPPMPLPLHASSSLIFLYFTCSTFSLPSCALYLCNYKQCGAPLSHPFACSHLRPKLLCLDGLVWMHVVLNTYRKNYYISRLLSRWFKEFHCR